MRIVLVVCKGGRCMYSCGRKKKDDFNDLVGGCPYYNNVGDVIFCGQDVIEDDKVCENVGPGDEDSYLSGDKGQVVGHRLFPVL